MPSYILASETHLQHWADTAIYSIFVRSHWPFRKIFERVWTMGMRLLPIPVWNEDAILEVQQLSSPQVDECKMWKMAEQEGEESMSSVASFPPHWPWITYFQAYYYMGWRGRGGCRAEREPYLLKPLDSAFYHTHQENIRRGVPSNG